MPQEIEERAQVLTLNVEQVLTQGRDLTLVCSSPEAESESLKAIIDSDLDASVGTVKFGVRKSKLYLFEKASGKRIDL